MSSKFDSQAAAACEKRIVFLVTDASHVDTATAVRVDPGVYKSVARAGASLPPTSAVIGAADISGAGGPAISWTRAWHAAGLLRGGVLDRARGSGAAYRLVVTHVLEDPLTHEDRRTEARGRCGMRECMFVLYL